jgi:hypothetical protein
VKKNIESTRKFYRVILRHLETKVTRYDVYRSNPNLWLSVSLRMFPLSRPSLEVIEMEKDLDSIAVGNQQYFLNQLVAKLRSIVDDDDDSENYEGYDYFRSRDLRNYGERDLSWYYKSFGLDEYSCVLIRSIFRGELEVEWEKHDVETV